MADSLNNDRMIISQCDATFSELNQTIKQLDGLADALELQECENLSINVRKESYVVHLRRPVQQNYITTNGNFVTKSRREIVKDIITPNRFDQERQFHNIISARLMSGQTHQPWQFRCHPLLLCLLSLSKVTPESFIANMKGHIGRFRSHASEGGYNDNRRRNFSKILFPIEYEARGGNIVLDTIKITKEMTLRFTKGKENQALILSLAGTQIPATIAASISGQSLKMNSMKMFDDQTVEALLAEQVVDRIENHAAGCTIYFYPQDYAPMAEGSERIDQEYDRLVDKLKSWADKDPLSPDKASS